MPEYVNPPLKRHPALQPFSRDHYLALVRAQHLITSADRTPADRTKALQEFLDTFLEEIRQHFDDEERLLVPLAPEHLATELKRQHANLRQLGQQAATVADPTPDFVRTLGQSYNDHIRWEERQFFPAIEQSAPPEKLLALLSETESMESTRPRCTCPTRKPRH